MAKRRPIRDSGGPVRVVGYARVSSEEQAAHGVSLADQRERLEAYATANGHALAAVLEEPAVSASVSPTARPVLARALAMLAKGEADALVVTRLDRLSRVTRDVLALVDTAKREGWRLVSMTESLDTETPHGRLVVTMLAAVAEMERERIRERTREGLARVAREKRARSHRIPFGWRVAGYDGTETPGGKVRLIPDTKEAEIRKIILGWNREGLGARAIVTALEEGGIRNPRPRDTERTTGEAKPGTWHYSTVRSILATARRLEGSKRTA